MLLEELQHTPRILHRRVCAVALRFRVGCVAPTILDVFLCVGIPAGEESVSEREFGLDQEWAVCVNPNIVLMVPAGIQRIANQA